MKIILKSGGSISLTDQEAKSLSEIILDQTKNEQFHVFVDDSADANVKLIINFDDIAAVVGEGDYTQN